MEKTHFWNFAIVYRKYGEILKRQREGENRNIIHFLVASIKAMRVQHQCKSAKHLYFQCFAVSCKLLFEKQYPALKFASVF